MGRGPSTPTTPSGFGVNTFLVKNLLGLSFGVKNFFGENSHFLGLEFFTLFFSPDRACVQIINMAWA